MIKKKIIILNFMILIFFIGCQSKYHNVYNQSLDDLNLSIKESIYKNDMGALISAILIDNENSDLDLAIQYIKNDLKKQLDQNNFFKIVRNIINLNQIGGEFNQKKIINYFEEIINNEKNYYYQQSLKNYIERYLPNVYKKLKINNYNYSFINSYQDVKNNVAQIYHDKGFVFQNGQRFPNIEIGTGFYINETIIATNNHVIQTNKDSYSYIYIYKGNKKIKASVIFQDEKFDIALIKIPIVNKNFKYMKYNFNPSEGDTIISCSSGAGLEHSFSKGIISNLSRDVLALTTVYQSDAAINPGSSGGPVLDQKFNLLGISFAGLPNFENINFIIPIEAFDNILLYSKFNKIVDRSFLGLALDENLRIFGSLNIIINKKNNMNFNNGTNLYINNINSYKTKSLDRFKKYVMFLPNNTIIKAVISGKNKKYQYNLKTKYRYTDMTKYIVENCSTFEYYKYFLYLITEKYSNHLRIKKILLPKIFDGINPQIGDGIKILKLEYNKYYKMYIMKIEFIFYSKGNVKSIYYIGLNKDLKLIL